MQRALITGGAGCLGLALARELAARAVDVRILDLRPGRGVPYAYVRGSVLDERALRDAAKGMDVIFNLSALQPVARAGGEFWRVNVGGTENVIASALAEGGAHVVHLSSSIVYGVPSGRPFREDDPLRPLGAYGKSKCAGEERCAAARSRGLTVTVIRPRVIMGPGRLGLFWVLFEWIRQNRRVYLIGNGENRFQMSAVEDLARACALAAAMRIDDTLNIGSDDVPRVRDVLEHLIRHAGVTSKVAPLPAAPARMALRLLDRFGLAPLTSEHYLFADKNFVVDTRRAKRLLGWQPLVADADALCSAYDFYAIEGLRQPNDFAPDRPPLGLLEVLRRLS